MNLQALLLFGSRARGDQTQTSDIDLLAITPNDRPTVSGHSTASLFHYSFEWLEEKASDGDLFLWHLVSEATAIYDPDSALPRLQNTFQFRSNYKQTIADASDVGWMVHCLGSELPPKMTNRWLAWSVRTISIARAAELKSPAFAGSALALVNDYPAIERLVRQKDATDFDSYIDGLFVGFLRHLGRSKLQDQKLSMLEYQEYFRDSGNEVGLAIASEPEPAPFYARQSMEKNLSD